MTTKAVSKMQKDVAICKLLLLGYCGTGKTSICFRFETGCLYTEFIFQCPMNSFGRVIDIEGKKVQLEIWDTSGHFRYETLVKRYLRNVVGLVIVYNITMRDSFEYIRSYRKMAIEEEAEDLPTVLVGHDCEMENKRVVSYQEGLEVAKKYNWTFFEISSKSFEDVNAMFTLLAKKCLEKKEKDKPPISLLRVNAHPQCTLSKPERQAGIFKRGFLKVKNRLFQPKCDNSDANSIDTSEELVKEHINTQSRINNRINDQNEPESYTQKTLLNNIIKPKEHEQSNNIIEPESCQNLPSHPPLGEYISGETSEEMNDIMPRPRADSLQFPEPVNPEYTHTRTGNTVENLQSDEISSQSEVEPEQCLITDIVEPESCVLLTDKRFPVEDVDETEYFDGNHFI